MVTETCPPEVNGVERISFENHRLAKRAKDIGSAAVMLSLLNAALVWALIILS